MRTSTSLTLLLVAAVAVSGCERDLTSPGSGGDPDPVAPAGAALGNTSHAGRCKDYQNWYTRDGQPFASVGECVAYGAKRGNQLINEAALACLSGGWEDLGGSAPFSSEQQCVDYAVGTGTPVTFADVRIGTDPGTIGCGAPFDPAYCTSIHIRVYNDGPVSVTVSWSLNGTYQRTESLWTEMFTSDAGTCTVTDDGLGTWSASCSGVSVPPGGSTFIAHVIAREGATQAGTVRITASSLPDPDSSNDSYSWNFTAPSH